MKTTKKYNSNPQASIPAYAENAALQLWVILGVTYIAFHAARVVMLVAGVHKDRVFHLMYANFGMSDYHLYSSKWWTFLTYGWIHADFFTWLSNMIWIFCFGSILQQMISFKNVIPLFVMSIIMGGIFFGASQFLFPNWFRPDVTEFFTGSYAGVMAIAWAGVVIAPGYRASFLKISLPIVLLVIIYCGITILSFLPNRPEALILCAGGALTGALYGRCIKRGYQPGLWVYNAYYRMENWFTPKEK